MPAGPIGDVWASGSWEWWELGSWGTSSAPVSVPEYTRAINTAFAQSAATGLACDASSARNADVDVSGVSGMSLKP